MTIAVDFDGTIVDHRFPEIGKPKTMAFEVLKALNADGHKLILWSNREGKRLEEAVEFCRENGVEFYSVNSEFPNASWSGSGVSRKIVADLYIDDKNFGGIPSWSEIYQQISNKSAFSHVHHHSSSHSHHHHSSDKKNIFTLIGTFFKTIVQKCKDARQNLKFE